MRKHDTEDEWLIGLEAEDGKRAATDKEIAPDGAESGT